MFRLKSIPNEPTTMRSAADVVILTDALRSAPQTSISLASQTVRSAADVAFPTDALRTRARRRRRRRRFRRMR